VSVQVGRKLPRPSQFRGIEELRLDTVRAVVAQLYAPERMGALNVKLEQQFAGDGTARRR
jgi:hypothetical protein